MRQKDVPHITNRSPPLNSNITSCQLYVAQQTLLQNQDSLNFSASDPQNIYGSGFKHTLVKE